MTAKLERVRAWAAELVLAAVCALALFGVSPAAGMKRLADAWNGSDPIVAAWSIPHLSVRVTVEVRP
jgi:hypothetical protein